MSSCVIDYFDTTDDQPPITDVQGIQQVEDAAEAPILLQVRVVSGFVRFKGWSRVSLRVSSKCLWSILLTKNHIYKGFPQSFYSRDIKGQIEVAITELTPGNSLLRPGRLHLAGYHQRPKLPTVYQFSTEKIEKTSRIARRSWSVIPSGKLT